MKWIQTTKTLELTARNISALTDKLHDPLSARALGSPCGKIMVRAVEDADTNEADAMATEGVIILTRSQLVELATEGAAVAVAGIAVTSVPDAAHYSRRPSGIVAMPSSGEVRGPDVSHWRLHHICEVCGSDEILTPTEAYNAGWDYPPHTSDFTVISPRCCPKCPNSATAWWAVAMDGYTETMLDDAQRTVIARILAEPASIMVTEEESK